MKSLLLLIAGVALASEPAQLSPTSSVRLRCGVTDQEYHNYLELQFTTYGSYSITKTQHATALAIRYDKDPGNEEIMRCVSQIAASKSTQRFFTAWANSYRDAKVETNHLWEIWIKDRLVMFLGVPEPPK